MGLRMRQRTTLTGNCTPGGPTVGGPHTGGQLELDPRVLESTQIFLCLAHPVLPPHYAQALQYWYLTPRGRMSGLPRPSRPWFFSKALFVSACFSVSARHQYLRTRASYLRTAAKSRRNNGAARAAPAPDAPRRQPPAAKPRRNDGAARGGASTRRSPERPAGRVDVPWAC